jgi:hypothetical protein
MKRFIYITFIWMISGCFLLNNEQFMAKKVLSTGITIELYYSGGGATAPDIIWVKKITKDGQKTLIGQINAFTNSDKVDIKEVDSSHISLNFVNEKDFQGHSIVFVIDLNSKIERNAGYPFNQPQ